MSRKKHSENTPLADMDQHPSAESQKTAGTQEDFIQDAGPGSGPGSTGSTESAAAADPAEIHQGGPEAENHAAAELSKQLEEMKDRFYRTAAEYENFRKRTAKEREGIGLNAAAETIAAFLPILDNITRARDVAKEADIAVKEGLALVLKQFDEILDKLGVSPIPAVGNSFDPEKHNAVMHVEDDSLGDNVVVEEFQKGYQMGDRIIRFSMVKVAN